MSIAEQVRSAQNVKEMTRKAIKFLIACGQDASDLVEEFSMKYGEPV